MRAKVTSPNAATIATKANRPTTTTDSATNTPGRATPPPRTAPPRHLSESQPSESAEYLSALYQSSVSSKHITIVVVVIVVSNFPCFYWAIIIYLCIQSATVYRGNNITFYCNIDQPGRPETLEYSWYVGGDKLADIRSQQMSHIMTKDEGGDRISCEARNSAGWANS